jgi:hypothetical protein
MATRRLPVVNGHRISALSITRFCPHAEGEENVAGRAAAQSTAFHALCAGAPEAASLFAALTEDERAELAEWKKPTPLKLPAVELLWSEGVNEVPLGLTHDFAACAYDAPERMTQGTADKVWEEAAGIIVADLKRSRWRHGDPNSLQLVAYCLAAVAKATKPGFAPQYYTTAIWDLTEGQWSVGRTVEVGSLEHAEDCAAVKQAALNMPGPSNGYNQGSHCGDCYNRERCPSYLMPMSVAETDLAVFTAETNFDLLPPERRLEVKLTLDRIKKTLEVANRIVSESVKRVPISDGKGKEYRMVDVKGSLVFDKKRFEAEHPELFQQYVSVGAGHQQPAWRKER